MRPALLRAAESLRPSYCLRKSFFARGLRPGLFLGACVGAKFGWRRLTGALIAAGVIAGGCLAYRAVGREARAFKGSRPIPLPMK